MTDDEEAALRDEVRALRAQIDELRRGLDVTLRGGRCRACGGMAVIHSPQVEDRGQYAAHALALKRVNKATIGELEVYLCAQCGLVEWYVKDPQAVADSAHMVPRDPGDPYR